MHPRRQQRHRHFSQERLSRRLRSLKRTSPSAQLWSVVAELIKCTVRSKFLQVRGGWQLSSGHHDGMDKERALSDLAEATRWGYTTLDCGDIYSGVEELIGMHRVKNWSATGDAALRFYDANETGVNRQALRVHTKFVPDIR